MSVAEMKQVVDNATLEERQFLEAYLEHLRRKEDPSNAEELDRRFDQMEQGVRMTIQEVYSLHESKKAKGQ